MGMQGFRRGFQRAEVIHSLRAIAEKATQCNVPVYVSQIDFARASVSVRHTAIRRAMLSRGVPPLLVAMHSRDMRHSFFRTRDSKRDRYSRPSAFARDARSARWFSAGYWRKR